MAMMIIIMIMAIITIMTGSPTSPSAAGTPEGKTVMAEVVTR